MYVNERRHFLVGTSYIMYYYISIFLTADRSPQSSFPIHAISHSPFPALATSVYKSYERSKSLVPVHWPNCDVQTAKVPRTNQRPECKIGTFYDSAPSGPSNNRLTRHSRSGRHGRLSCGRLLRSIHFIWFFEILNLVNHFLNKLLPILSGF